MKQNVTFEGFVDAFRDMGRNTNFSYNGLRALYDYLEQLGDDIGEEIDLDVIALCCDYSEYESALDCIKDCGYNHEPDKEQTEEEQEEAAREYLRDNTTLIEFETGIIIQEF